MIDELKPCRFCTCDQIQLEVRENWTDPYARYCRNCRMYGPIAKTVEEANKHWNSLNNTNISVAINKEDAKIYAFALEERLYPLDKTSLNMIINKIYRV